MTKETARVTSVLLGGLAALSFLLMCGGCFLFAGSFETEYGREELYQKPDGSVGYAAKSQTSGGDGLGYYIVIPLLVGVGSLIASGFFSNIKNEMEEKEKESQM